MSRTLRRGRLLEPVPWRVIRSSVLLPNLIIGVAHGVTILALPLTALALGTSYATAALVAALMGVGQLVTTLPSGWLLAHVGERRVIIASAATTVAAGIVCWTAPNPVALGLGSFLMGCGATGFLMARHTWVTMSIHRGARGRVLSLTAGCHRLGLAIGPFAAAGVFQLSKDPATAFVIVVTSGIALSALLTSTFPKSARSHAPETPRPSVLTTIRVERSALLRVGLLISTVATARATRRILVPLVATAVGIGASEVAVLVGATSVLDFLLFYAGGQIVDRWGPLWIGVSTMAGFGLAHAALGIALVVSHADAWVVASAVVMAVANGLSSGLVATIGSDLADPTDPAAFLAAWRLVTEIGPTAAPLALSAIAAGSSLAIACGVLSAAAVLAAVALPAQLRRFSQRMLLSRAG